MSLSLDLTARHLVLGFGATGLSIARTLHSLGIEKNLLDAIDSRAQPPNYQEMKQYCGRVRTGGFDTTLLNDSDYLWISPGIALTSPALHKTLSRLHTDCINGDIELFAHLNQGRVLAITGTNGKSTVTTLLAQMCQAAGLNTLVGGNLGEPALDLWLRAQRHAIEQPVYVLELSSFQLETTHHLNAEVASILNIQPDHLDRYDDFDHYARTKLHLLSQAKQWVLNQDDAILNAYIQSHPHQTTAFSLHAPTTPQDNAAWHIRQDSNTHKITIYHHDQAIIDTEQLNIGGLHNIANVLAACAMASCAGLPDEAIINAIKQFTGLPHRCVLIATINGVRYFDDSKATNLPATLAAINGFNDPKWLILGGVTKAQDFSALQTQLPSSIRGILLIGHDIQAIASQLPKQLQTQYVHTLENAVRYIHEHAVTGDIVLFSPACASFDQFQNYQHRGQVFQDLVTALI